MVRVHDDRRSGENFFTISSNLQLRNLTIIARFVGDRGCLFATVATSIEVASSSQTTTH
ncbi:hypothetical protein TIFTF001_053623 [Ficus carica]|uniref:Uncharacterized protein n=1 Tax=Ficus carica TaxID=3494 RepID=A0AA88EGT7_FICCA|nr:hypothetical protein TIFTF001_053622 [Ficus carica]GMN72976.1 hypothetical protein TIFTF001_053623 [Ficus carica]